MKKISTGLKIILAFMFIALIFGFVGFMGIVGIEKINTDGDRLYTKNTMGIAYSGNAALSFDMIQINLMKLGILTDKDEKQKMITEIKDELNDLDTWLAQYESIIGQNDTENLTLFDSLKQNWETYKGFVSYSLGYCTDNAGLDLSRFTSGFVLEKKELSDTIENMFNSMVKLNQDSASNVNKQNTTLGQSTIMLMMILVPLGIIISIILGIIFGKSISKTVRRTSSQLKKLADGENVDDLDVNKFSGEFATIATNLNAVQASLQRLLFDAGELAAAGIEGKLSTRADLSAHKGNYRAIIEDFNKSLDAFTAPVNEMVEVLKSMQQGSLSVSVTGDYPGDYAEIKEALNDTVRTINRYVEEVSTILEKMSVGDLTQSIDTDYRGDFLTLRDSINRINESLNALLKDIMLSANQVAAGTRHVSDGSQSISIGATEQASAIEQLTTTVSHIAEQTKLNAQNAGQAKTLSQDVGKSAKGGDTDMEHMQQAMIDIRSSSENISRIIKVIDDIAFQTNILALNAAVEAARAGVHGRGFAVVADEVRNLAVRSAKAAAETTDLIENSIQKVQQGTAIANQTAESLRKILAGIENTAALVSDIADASNQQASAIIQVNNGIENLTGVVQNNSATSEQTAAAAQELSSQAEMLRSMVRQFSLKDDTFDTGVVLPEEPVKLYAPDSVEASIDLDPDDFGKY